jgi:hypothetical protein
MRIVKSAEHAHGHLTTELATRWASSAQYYFLDALMADPGIQYEQFAFHGGTSTMPPQQNSIKALFRSLSHRGRPS